MASTRSAAAPFGETRIDRATSLRRIAAALGLALALGGCMGGGSGSPFASSNGALPSGDEALRGYANEWGQKFEAHPGDVAAALNYSRALKALTRYSEAVAVLQAAAIKNPRERAVLGAYGKALADVGRFREAADILPKAHSPERPDWSILSAQGLVADQLGDFPQAQSYYTAALKIAPGEPAVLSNLGLSYALEKRLPEAESTLRQASANPRADIRVRQNLALVLALEGKFPEADGVLRRDLSPEDAAANVASIRGMIAQSNTWRDIQKLNGKAPRQPATPPA